MNEQDPQLKAMSHVKYLLGNPSQEKREIYCYMIAECRQRLHHLHKLTRDFERLIKHYAKQLE